MINLLLFFALIFTDNKPRVFMDMASCTEFVVLRYDFPIEADLKTYIVHSEDNIELITEQTFEGERTLRYDNLSRDTMFRFCWVQEGVNMYIFRRSDFDNFDCTGTEIEMIL